MVIAGAVALACVAGGGLAAAELRSELTRPATRAELDRATEAELALRWRRWPVGKIFPERVKDKSEESRRVGIGKDTTCAEALDEALPKCRAVVRATYLDAMQGLVVTVGLAVFPDEAAAKRAESKFEEPGLRALSFARTASARFDDAARQAGTAQQDGPYVLLTTTGQADGRPAKAVRRKNPRVSVPATEISDVILERITEPAIPDCAKEAWSC